MFFCFWKGRSRLQPHPPIPTSAFHPCNSPLPTSTLQTPTNAKIVSVSMLKKYQSDTILTFWLLWIFMHYIKVLLLRKSQTSEQPTTLRTNEQDIGTTPAPELKKFWNEKNWNKIFGWIASGYLAHDICPTVHPSRPCFLIMPYNVNRFSVFGCVSIGCVLLFVAPLQMIADNCKHYSNPCILLLNNSNYKRLYIVYLVLNDSKLCCCVLSVVSYDCTEFWYKHFSNFGGFRVLVVF